MIAPPPAEGGEGWLRANAGDGDGDACARARAIALWCNEKAGFWSESQGRMPGIRRTAGSLDTPLNSKPN